MKKNKLLIICLSCMLFSCNGNNDSLPILNVNTSPIYGVENVELTLPQASATYKGNDISDSVKVNVLNDDKVLFSGLGKDVNTYTPLDSGAYDVHYQAQPEESPWSDDVIIPMFVSDEVTIGQGEMITIDVDTLNSVFNTKETIKTRAASATNKEGADVSNLIKVSVFDDAHKKVFSGDGSKEQTLDVKEGTYKVVYEIEDEAYKANQIYYYLVVAKYVNTTPELDIPTTPIEGVIGEEISIPQVNAFDFEDGDISNSITYRIVDSKGTILEENKPQSSAASFTFTGAGDYEIIYSVKDGEDLAAQEKSLAIKVDGYRDVNLTLDGVIDEKDYFKIPAYKFGINQGVNARFAVADEGLYFGATVKDRNIINVNAATEAAFNTSDGIELYFNPTDSKNLTVQNTKCFRLRYSSTGKVMKYDATTINDQWKLVDSNLADIAVVTVDGTSTVFGRSDDTAKDVDNGYTVESMIPWSFFGYEQKPTSNYIRVQIGQRNVLNSTTLNAYNPNGTPNNIFVSGTQTNARPKVATEGLNPSLYSYLYINGTELGVNPTRHTKDVTIDGLMETSFWDDAYDIPLPVSTQKSIVTAKAKMTQEGIYIGGHTTDSQLIAREAQLSGNSGIFTNDCFDIRIVTGDEMNLAALAPVNTVTNSKIISVDCAGTAMMQSINPNGFNRNSALYPFEYGISVNGTVGTSQFNDKFDDANKFIADYLVDDLDGGWGVEIFVPYETVGLTRPQEGELVKIRVMVASYDRNVTLYKAGWAYSYSDFDKSMGSDPASPLSYILIEQQF